MKRYDPKTLEPTWQKTWDDQQIYKTDLKSPKQKYFAMSMFNYPSGNGIHIGHAFNYTISDVLARVKRQQGFESYHPVGWDSFGLPAENFAIKSGISPQESMKRIIPGYHTQYKAMGWSNDWSKEITTSEPEYYKWTQWIFSEMHRAGLAYQEPRMQWWCDKCQTVLANEQVIDNKCWRHDAADDPEVAKKEVKQWFFKVTEYADEMLEATKDLDWSDVVKSAQTNWIGKSQGAEIEFLIERQESRGKCREDVANALDSSLLTQDSKVTVFTTRPDTLFGATFLVLAPEHDLVDAITSDRQKTVVADYKKQALKKSELERQESKEKTGVFTGAYAKNPATGKKIPVWIADYVLVGYGTGAIMAVPAHDERDFEFATKFDLPITQVVMPMDIDSFNPPQDAFDMVERPTAIVHLRDKSTGKYALLDWHNTLEGITTAIMGGVEDGQTPEQAALAEIREEAGLGAKIVKMLPWVTAAEYCASHKQQNRRAISYGFIAEVDNLDNQQPVDAYETKTHTLKWVNEAEVLNTLTPSHQKYVWELLHTQSSITGEGLLMNSGQFDGMPTSEAREQIVDWLEQQGIGKSKTTFKIRDWSVSRQRYWGAPIPIVHCQKDGAVLLPDSELPVLLPELDDFKPSGDGRSALARATDWLKTTCPTCGGPAERETDTLDTYICSSWYFLRYLDPQNAEQPFATDTANKWMPVDFYNGGDHATAHMMYARFMTRFFWHKGLVNNPEPFKKFLFNGKITASDGTMFSKSKGNGVDPLEIINSGYGADALRTYLMFAAPLEQWVRWDPQGVPGAYRFLNRVWTLVQEFTESNASEAATNADILRVIHPAIKKVTADLDDLKYNTAIAAMMEATNDLYKLKVTDKFAARDDWQFALNSLVALVAPFAPHMADELWRDLGHTASVQRDSWPKWNDDYLTSDSITVVVQVNGKLRTTLAMPKNSSKDDMEKAALADEKVAAHTNGKSVVKTIVIPGKLVNIVVK